VRYGPAGALKIRQINSAILKVFNGALIGFLPRNSSHGTSDVYRITAPSAREPKSEIDDTRILLPGRGLLVP
jgi:hypothetical protein